MYICIHIYIFIHVYTYIYIYAYICMHTSYDLQPMNMCMHTYVQTHMYVSRYQTVGHVFLTYMCIFDMFTHLYIYNTGNMPVNMCGYLYA